MKISPQPAHPNLPIKSIPNEVSSRDSVFAVCFCFLFSIAPHFPNLPIWVVVIVAVSMSWRCLQNLGRLRELPKWLLIPLVLIGGVAVFAEYWTIAMISSLSSFNSQHLFQRYFYIAQQRTASAVTNCYAAIS